MAEAARIRDAARMAMGEQVAAQGSNGFQQGTGSALDALAQSQVNAAFDALTVRQTAAARARARRIEGDIAYAAGSNALTQGMIGAASSVYEMKQDWASARAGSTAPAERPRGERIRSLMAQERGYERQVGAASPVGLPDASPASFGAGVGAAIAEAGQTVHQAELRAYQIERQQTADSQAADFAARFARTREAADQAAIDARNGAAPGGAGHADAMAAWWETQATSLADGITDDRVRRRAQEHLEEFGGRFRSSAYQWQEGTRVGKLVTDTGVATDLAANRARRSHDPKSYAEELSLGRQSIEAMTGVPVDVRDKLLRAHDEAVTVGYFNGLIDTNPAVVPRLLDSGGFDAMLSPEQMERLRNRIGGRGAPRRGDGAGAGGAVDRGRARPARRARDRSQRRRGQLRRPDDDRWTLRRDRRQEQGGRVAGQGGRVPGGAGQPRLDAAADGCADRRVAGEKGGGRRQCGRGARAQRAGRPARRIGGEAGPAGRCAAPAAICDRAGAGRARSERPGIDPRARHAGAHGGRHVRSRRDRADPRDRAARVQGPGGGRPGRAAEGARCHSRVRRRAHRCGRGAADRGRGRWCVPDRGGDAARGGARYFARRRHAEGEPAGVEGRDRAQRLRKMGTARR